MKRTLFVVLAALAMISALALVGCNSNTTRISSILQSTDRYVNKDVTVAGEITKTYSVNLVIAEAGAYQVDDGTGKIWVITKNGVPRQGQKVGLKGRVESGIRLGRETFGAVIQESDRRVK